jgi:ABC-type amino acid transport system permease subunit
MHANYLFPYNQLRTYSRVLIISLIWTVVVSKKIQSEDLHTCMHA